MEIKFKFIIAYKTKCDNVTRYYEARNEEHALQSARELNKYKNLFKNIRIIKELVKD